MTQTKNTAHDVGRDAADKVRDAVSASPVAKKAKDAAYTMVGLGVMGAQKANVATKQVTKRFGAEDAGSIDLDSLRGRADDAKEMARRQFTKVDTIFGDAIARIEEAFAPIEDRLPDQAKDTVGKVREAGKGLHTQVRTRVTGESADAHRATTSRRTTRSTASKSAASKPAATKSSADETGTSVTD
jgi:hypothetical protein